MPRVDAPALGDGDEAVDILVVDDLPEKLLVFRTVLEELGQNVVVARSGQEALRALLQRDFAVILLDVNMPDMDGFETAELIRGYPRSAQTPIIFVTSYADEMQTARGYSLGAVDYILAPVIPEVLRSKVSVFCALHSAQRLVRRQADDRAARLAAEAARAEAERAHRRSAFLSLASRELGGTLDAAVGASRLASLVCPQHSRLATVALAGENGGVVQVWTAVADGGEPARRIDWVALPAQQRDTLRRAMETRARVVQDGAGPPALAAVPITSSDRVYGALLTDADADTDGVWLEQIAVRAGAAFENARLYEILQAEIVERRHAEAELQLANQRKDEFLAMLSHELRNPLGAIRAALELIRRAVTEPKVTWAGEIMDRQLHHMTRLIEELLDVARISQDKIELTRERVDLNRVVAQSVEVALPSIEARHQTLTVRRPDTPVWLMGDTARLAQIVSNLLSNASNYSDDGTLIELECEVDSAGALIRVRDHGAGIDAELLPRVFDLFQQGSRGLDRSQGGLGVGLTLAQRLARLHGGHIEAESDGPGQGSEFRVRLPALRLASGEVASPDGGGARNDGHEPRRVLVVDDNRDAARSIAEVLQFDGHQVRTAGDGYEALAACEIEAPEVVLLDLGLPRLDGFEVARRLRRTDAMRGALLIALTGYGQPDDIAAARDAGFDAHFVKPADLDALAARIAQWRPPVSGSVHLNGG